MITTAKILKYDDSVIVIEPTEAVSREILRKQINAVEIRLNDGRQISAIQRKKIFAIIRDISVWCGHVPEYLRQYLTWDFACEHGCDWFSLSDVDMTVAKDYITYLIDFCFYHDIPTKDTLLNQTDDIGKYLYLCLEHRKCAVCNGRAQTHHVDRVGMGRNREKIVHVGLLAVALCAECHEKAHRDEKEFFKLHHIYGIRLDEYLCNILNLNTKQKGLPKG